MYNYDCLCPGVNDFLQYVDNQRMTANSRVTNSRSMVTNLNYDDHAQNLIQEKSHTNTKRLKYLQNGLKITLKMVWEYEVGIK